MLFNVNMRKNKKNDFLHSIMSSGDVSNCAAKAST